MPLIALDLPPGLRRNGTTYEAEGRWVAASLIRFLNGTIRPVGGWVRAAPSDMDGPGRGICAWRPFNNARQAAIGTPGKLFSFDDDQLADITPASFPSGFVDTFYGEGYGFGDYGPGPYGGDGASGARTDATSWSLDNFGQYLVACASHDGNIYLWELDPITPAALMSVDAPTARSVFVTPERFIVAVGAGGNSRKVAWPDQESTTDWTTSLTNQAGDFEIQTDGLLLCGLRVRGESLLFSTTDVWTMTYIDAETVYGFHQVGQDCGLAGQRAAVAFLGGAAWMSYQSFYVFDGGSVRPIPCEVADDVFGDMDRDQIAKTHGGHNSAFGEITWWYPSLSMNGALRSVTWNYRENHWTVGGQPERTCWEDAGSFVQPLAANSVGRLFRQEDGWTNDGATRAGTVYLRSGPAEIGSGDQVMSVVQVLPDESTPGATQLRLATRFTPEGALFSYGPYPLKPYTNVRVTGRAVAVRLDGVLDQDFRIGRFRFDVRTGSKR
jgi:hypothetical protein